MRLPDTMATDLFSSALTFDSDPAYRAFCTVDDDVVRHTPGRLAPPTRSDPHTPRRARRERRRWQRSIG